MFSILNDSVLSPQLVHSRNKSWLNKLNFVGVAPECWAHVVSQLEHSPQPLAKAAAPSDGYRYNDMVYYLDVNKNRRQIANSIMEQFGKSFFFSVF